MKKKPNFGNSSFSQKKAKDDAIEEIHKKIANSSALNGGFETLLFKIDKIEQSQGQLVNKVDKIHDAIYDPNEGMYSKIMEHKLESSEKFGELAKGMTEINAWKVHKESEEETFEQSIQRLQSLENSVGSLVKSKESTWSVMKWFVAAIGGGLMTLLFAWIERKIK